VTAVKAKVTTLDNKSAGNIDLDEAVFGLPGRADILQRVVTWQLAKRRAGTHKVKTVGEIAGSGAKPWRQKGTGRARHGSRRSSQWRGGATVFGPVVRSHAFALPKKVRKLGLKTALSVKQAEGKLIVVDEAKVTEAKTGVLAKLLSGLGWSSGLVVDGPEVGGNFARAGANIPK
jgi:large subunit ribosomal protein L4